MRLSIGASITGPMPWKRCAPCAGYAHAVQAAPRRALKQQLLGQPLRDQPVAHHFGEPACRPESDSVALALPGVCHQGQNAGNGSQLGILATPCRHRPRGRGRRLVRHCFVNKPLRRFRDRQVARDRVDRSVGMHGRRRDDIAAFAPNIGAGRKPPRAARNLDVAREKNMKSARRADRQRLGRTAMPAALDCGPCDCIGVVEVDHKTAAAGPQPEIGFRRALPPIANDGRVARCVPGIPAAQASRAEPCRVALMGRRQIRGQARRERRRSCRDLRLRALIGLDGERGYRLLESGHRLPCL